MRPRRRGLERLLVERLHERGGAGNFSIRRRERVIDDRKLRAMDALLAIGATQPCQE